MHIHFGFWIARVKATLAWIARIRASRLAGIAPTGASIYGNKSKIQNLKSQRSPKRVRQLPPAQDMHVKMKHHLAAP